jgi:neutral ceramidase
MAAAPLKAAVWREEITPPLNTKLMGFGAEAKSIHSKLYARLLLLEQAGKRCLIVSLDALWATEAPVMVRSLDGKGTTMFAASLPEHTRRDWANAAKIDDTALSINPSHTHYAPKLSDTFRNRITERIKQLPSALQPVRVSLAAGPSHVAVARRVPPNTRPEQVPIDRTLIVVSLHPLDGAARPLARLVNYGVHLTDLVPTDQASSHITGGALESLEGEAGGPTCALFLQGFSGDLGPNKKDPKWNGTSWDFNFSKEEMDRYTLQFKNDVKEVAKSLRPLASDDLRIAHEKVELNTVRFPEAKKPLNISGIAIGEMVLLSYSGEMFNQYGPLLTHLRPHGYTLSAGVANGYSGYIPTKAAFHDQVKESYEMTTTPYPEGVEGQVLDGTKAVLKSLGA